jgi:hypothetical protein
MQLGGEGQGNPALMGIDEEEIHAVWLATGEGRYYTHSLDAGNSWASPSEFTPKYSGMLVGYVNLVVDSADQIHLFVEGSAEPMHSVWNGRQWSPFEPVGHGESAMAAITQGDHLHFVWLNPATMHYASRIIQNAPAVPTIPILDTVEPNALRNEDLSEKLPPPQGNSTLVLTVDNQSHLHSVASPQTSKLIIPLLWSTGATGLVAGIAIWLYRTRRNSRR